MGRADRVLALLIDGEPDQSFPAVMRHRRRAEGDASAVPAEEIEPIAADVRHRRDLSTRKVKRFALLRLVAALIGCTFDDLRRRDLERQRRRQLQWGAVAAALLLMLTGGYTWWWDQYKREKSAYYATLVWRWGLPEGLGLLDANAHSHSDGYHVVTQGGKVRRVRSENSAGALTATTSDSPARWDVSYREDGAPERIRVFDTNERLLREDSFRGRDIISFQYGSEAASRAQAQAAAADPLSVDPYVGKEDTGAHAEITRHKLKFDPSGFVVERLYQNEYGSPRRNAEGSFGQRLVNSPEGLRHPPRRARCRRAGADIQERYSVHPICLFAPALALSLHPHGREWSADRRTGRICRTPRRI